MDLSTYTPIFVRTTGNDTLDGLTLATAVATVQQGYNIAMAAGSGNYVLDIGAGTFVGVVLTADWPVNIAVRGAGNTVSFFGGINGNGADGGDGVTSPAPGFNVTMIGDKSIHLGDISLAGGGGSNNYLMQGQDGGALSLTDVVIGNVSTVGGADNNSGAAGSGGSVSFSGITAEAISLFGSDCVSSGNGGSGGSVVAINSILGSIQTSGGSAPNGSGGTAGDISLVNSKAEGVSANGGFGDCGPDGNAATVTLNGAFIQGIQAQCLGYSGNTGGGSATDSICGSINLVSASGIGNVAIYGAFQFIAGSSYSCTFTTASNYHYPDILGAGLL